jgi:hAT family C-terminal dimerisation region
VVAETLEEYKIVNKFFCFVGDNASNNNSTFIQGLNKYLLLEFTEENRIRCAGHIINLVVTAIIYGNNLSNWERELADAPLKKQFILFRQRGVVGKLHNFVNAVTVSNKRREAFEEVQKVVNEEIHIYITLNLLKDGGVRWHAVYLMLLRCWELKESIDRFIRRWRQLNNLTNGDEAAEEADGFNPLLDCLTPDEWDEVKELVDFLKSFYEMTKRLEGNQSNSGFGSIWQTITNLNLLDIKLREKKLSLHREPSSFIKTAVSQGLEKLTTYWTYIILKVSPSPYCIATILAPRLHLAWFKQSWKHYPTYYRKAEADMKVVFEEYVSQLADEVDEMDEMDEAVDDAPLPRKHTQPDDDYDATLRVDPHYMMGTKSKAKRQKALHELDNYYSNHNDDLMEFNEGRDDRLDHPLLWWKEVGRDLYPTLYRMALDYLSIPVTSCDCERAFSRGRRTVTDDRNRLGGCTIEALQLQKNWLKNNVVKSHLIDLVETIQRADKA